MAAPQLKFHGSPWRMTAATLPALLLLLCFYSAEEYLGSVVCFLLSVAFVALALHTGIAPAYFPHVDHPLHVLDRLRWGCGCVALLILFVASRCSNGCVFSYVSLRSQAVLSVQDYSEAGVADAGLVQINGLMDSSRIGAVASCSSCTTSECARKDCRREAALNNISDLPQMEGLHKLNFLENQILFRRLSGAGGGGGGGGGGGHGGKGNTCSITCLYVAPLLPAAAWSSPFISLGWYLRSRMSVSSLTSRRMGTLITNGTLAIEPVSGPYPTLVEASQVRLCDPYRSLLIEPLREPCKNSDEILTWNSYGSRFKTSKP